MLHKTKDGHNWLAIHEVYYNEEGKIWGWTQEPKRLVSDNDVDDLIAGLEQTLKDAKKSKDHILDFDMEPEVSLDVEGIEKQLEEEEEEEEINEQ